MENCKVNRTQKRSQHDDHGHGGGGAAAAAAVLCCTSSSSSSGRRRSSSSSRSCAAAGGPWATLIWRRPPFLILLAILVVSCYKYKCCYLVVAVSAGETRLAAAEEEEEDHNPPPLRPPHEDVDRPRPFPAFFIFGDSLVDVGNNNYILSVAKADQLPYGIDFPKGPTGRFSNGKTVLDVVAELINLPFPPAYLDPVAKGKGILQGVNYASGAGGYLRSSGFNFIGRVDFDTQIEWFSNTIQELKEEVGESAAQQLLAKSLFITVFGSNDYVNNYLLSYSPLNKEYNLHDYKNIILQKTAKQITEVYKLGARTIVVSGVGPLGCIPSQLVRQRSVNGECSEYVNAIARDFNQGLQAVLHSLSQQLTGSKIVYADSYSATLKIVQNPALYGFKYGAQACCGAGKYKGQLLCLPVMEPCSNRSEHIFWDCFHPSEATNQYLGRDLFASLKAYIYN